MERILQPGASRAREARRALSAPAGALALALLATALLPLDTQAQPGGGPASYTLRVVDQDGRDLVGSRVRIEGTSVDVTAPATVTSEGGPQLFVIEPAVQGTQLPGGFLLPSGPNSLSRTEMIFLDPMGGEVRIEWRTATLEAGVVDQDGAAIAGATWSFEGSPGAYGAGPVVVPLTDAALYPSLAGGAAAGYRCVVTAAFRGQPCDLARVDSRAVLANTPDFRFTWRQLACSMGVVDATEAPIRGATWSVLGHTFEAGDAIVLPVTDEALYPGLSGALAMGFPTTLATATSSGAGAGVFEVTAALGLLPAFVDVNGGFFGLRCGVSAFPPLVTGTLAGRVTAQGEPLAGVVVRIETAGVTRQAATDTHGSYRVDELPAGPGTATVTVPAGYVAIEPVDGVRSFEVVAGQTATADFALAAVADPPSVTNDPRPWDYWRREVRIALGARGTSFESRDDLGRTYPEAIFEEYARHATAPVRVSGITFMDPDGAGALPERPLVLSELAEALRPAHGQPLRAARRELLVVLLNVVSHRLSPALVVGPAGLELDRAIRELAVMVTDGRKGNDAFARRWARRINQGLGPLAWPGAMTEPAAAAEDAAADGFEASIAAGDPDGANGEGPVSLIVGGGAMAGAGSGAEVRLTFALSQPDRVRLTVYDAAGRLVATVFEGDAPAGATTATWSAAGVRPGIYFARLMASAGVARVKVMRGR